MNPSEDPNDRLLDSLLREQARGKADDELLQAIDARLDAFPSPASRRRFVFLPWLVAAACLTILGVVWSLWQRDEERGGTSPTHPTVVESGLPKTKANRDNGPRPPETAPPSPSSRDSIDVVPAPDPSGNVVVTPVPKPVGGDPQMGPDGSGSQTLRDFAERRVASAGEGMRVRGLSFPADPTLTEVFAHDPDASEDTPATRIEVNSHLGAAGQFLSLKGDRVILSDRRERPVSESGTHVFGSIQVRRDATDGIFLMMPGTGKPAEPARRALLLDVSPGVAPAGSAFLINLSPAQIRIQMENELHDLKPGERKVVVVQPVGANGLTSVSGLLLNKGVWQRFFASAWPAPGAFRSIHIIWNNPGKRMVEIKGYRDQVLPGGRLGGVEKDLGNADTLDGLVYLKDESTMWYVQFGLESGGKWAPRFVGLRPDKKTKLQNRVSAVEMLSPGDEFFKEGVFAGRFKFLGMEEREVRNVPRGLLQRVKFGLYEDLKPNKKGMKYESQAGLPDAELEAKAYYDRTAILKFGDKEFRVEEYTMFRLPGNASRKEHFLRKVTPQDVVIETKGANGEVITREIPKAGP